MQVNGLCCVCACRYVYVCACVCLYMLLCVCICLCVCISLCTFVCMGTCVCMCMSLCACMRAHLCTHSITCPAPRLGSTAEPTVLTRVWVKPWVLEIWPCPKSTLWLCGWGRDASPHSSLPMAGWGGESWPWSHKTKRAVFSAPHQLQYLDEWPIYLVWARLWSWPWWSTCGRP